MKDKPLPNFEVSLLCESQNFIDALGVIFYRPELIVYAAEKYSKGIVNQTENLSDLLYGESCLGAILDAMREVPLKGALRVAVALNSTAEKYELANKYDVARALAKCYDEAGLDVRYRHVLEEIDNEEFEEMKEDDDEGIIC